MSFSLKDIKIHNVCIFGNRASGKTTLVRDILYKLDMPSFILSGIGSDEYCDVPNVLYSKTYTDTRQITSIFDRMSQDNRNPKILVLENLPESIYKLLEFRDIFMNSWAYRIIVIATFSSVYYLPPQIRPMIDCVFILRSGVHDKETLYQKYIGYSYFKNFHEFCSVLDKHTKDYGCVVMNGSRWEPFKAQLHRRRQWMINKTK